MIPMFAASGDANGLRTREVRHAVDNAHADSDLGRLRVGASFPPAVTVSVLSRYITFSASERWWQPLPFFHSRQPSRGIASTASLRQVAPSVLAGQ